MTNSTYYDLSKCLTHNRALNILTGGRGVGKTYGVKKFIIKDFEKNGNQFIWLRRFKTEIKIAKDGFFNKISPEFPEYKFELKGNQCEINKKLAGGFTALSTATSNKGLDKFQNIVNVVFDEYILDPAGFQRYLKNEMRLIFDLLETLIRTNKKVRVFFISNNVSEINPLYLYFGINFNKGNIWLDDNIYAEQIETSQKLIELKEQSPLTQIVKKYDETYYNYNVLNKSLNDNEKFIIKEPAKKRQAYSIIGDTNYFVYRFRNEQSHALYVTKNGNTSVLPLTFDVSLVNNKVKLLDKKEAIFKDLVNTFKRGELFFCDLEVKAFFVDILKKYI